MHDAYEKKLASKKSSSGRGAGDRPDRSDRADRSERGGREKKKRDKNDDDGAKPDKKSSSSSRRDGEKRGEDKIGEGSTNTNNKRGERGAKRRGEDSSVTGEVGPEDTADSATKVPTRILKKVFK